MSNIKSLKDSKIQCFVSQLPPTKRWHQSPEAWEDQLMYFLLPDRFSDGKERGYKDLQNKVVSSGTTLPFTQSNSETALGSDRAEEWLEDGKHFVGGTIKGVTSKLGYLKRMGVTAIWIGPPFKQIADLETYHGYGIQNFLEIEPRFGTKEEFRELVHCAHNAGIHVVLDVILNHCGNVFAYKNDDTRYTGKVQHVNGYWSANRQRQNMLPFGWIDEAKYPNAYPDGAVWPLELQDHNNFTQKGYICNWDESPECLEGDFFDLKAFNLGSPDPTNFRPTPALDALCEIYKFWISYADLDGFRIDTVRHMGVGPTRYFTSKIREFAQRLGKNNFLLVGEISDEHARKTVMATGLDAGLGICGLQEALNRVPRSAAPATAYFDSFTNGRGTDSKWAKNQVLTMLDDHDQIWRARPKARFCADADGALLIRAALGLNLCSQGIPCIYYGTEQNLDGTSEKPARDMDHYLDTFIREAMFGGNFGPFRSRNRHCFDETSSTYCFIRDIARLRENEIALRRGDQYLCAVSEASRVTRLEWLTNPASSRRSQSIVAWLRVYEGAILLCALNTSTEGVAKALVALEYGQSGPYLKGVFRCLYPAGELQNLRATRKRGAQAQVLLSVPSAGFVVYKFLSTEDQARACLL